MNAVYEPELTLEVQSMLTGEYIEGVTPGDGNPLWEFPIVKAFLEDDDLQEMQIVSTNIGFIRKLTKHYKRQEQ